ncbi:hypothetical protein ACOSP7_022928 [Xanthoceras sorbifolium]
MTQPISSKSKYSIHCTVTTKSVKSLAFRGQKLFELHALIVMLLIPTHQAMKMKIFVPRHPPHTQIG